MADYIDRESIKYEKWAVSPLCRPLMVVRKATIDNIPAADVAPVVHGKWEWHGPCRDNKGTYWATCSACKTRQRLGDYETYCPSCGAKMRDE